MKACLLVRGGPDGHQTAWATAFAAGLSRHGWQTEITDMHQSCDLLVLWGVRRQQEIQIQKDAGGEVCILERGYIGNRHHWSSVSFGGGLNGRGKFRGVSPDPERFNRNFPGVLKPWREQKGYALLIGQVPGDMSIKNVDIERWYSETAQGLREHGFDVKFRQHPIAHQRGMRCPFSGADLIAGDLHNNFDGAAVCVTFNSNTGVEAVLAGVPTVAFDAGSMVRQVAGHDLEEIRMMPPREIWAAELAWKQWSLEEMRSGLCWEVVGA